MRHWALKLNDLWKEFGRFPAELKSKSYYSSLLPIKNMIIVPGGRFRESYYWDTYWIVQGLLISDMFETAKGVVDNLLAYVKLYGFVPNGGRIYYTDRSQPPMLSEMVRLIYKSRRNKTWLRGAVYSLDIEYQYWMGESSASRETLSDDKKTYYLNRYVSSKSIPRPESFHEDFTKAPDGGDDSEEWYNNIRAAAASGWDFSSRWFENGKNLSFIATSRILPVDLNSILHRMEKNMAEFHSQAQNEESHLYYKRRSEERMVAIERFLWDESSGMWRDYWLDTKKLSHVTSASNYFPLWSESFKTQNFTRISLIINSFLESGLLATGGVLTTTTNSSREQWDSPNGWAPIQDLLIDGFRNTNVEQGRTISNRIRDSWLETCFHGWKHSPNATMFEKYNVLNASASAGHGGEYEVQSGFGWTNGVVLKWLTNDDNT